MADLATVAERSSLPTLYGGQTVAQCSSHPLAVRAEPAHSSREAVKALHMRKIDPFVRRCKAKPAAAATSLRKGLARRRTCYPVVIEPR